MRSHAPSLRVLERRSAWANRARPRSAAVRRRSARHNKRGNAANRPTAPSCHQTSAASASGQLVFRGTPSSAVLLRRKLLIRGGRGKAEGSGAQLSLQVEVRRAHAGRAASAMPTDRRRRYTPPDGSQKRRRRQTPPDGSRKGRARRSSAEATRRHKTGAPGQDATPQVRPPVCGQRANT